MSKDFNSLVSVITPVYNRQDYLTEMIESVISQSYTNWELLLIDDGSADNSWKIMQSYAAFDNRIKVLKRPSNRLKGGNAARNFGFENCLGIYVNWFDSDDKMHPNFIERKTKSFTVNSELDIVFSKTIKTNFNEIIVYDKRLKPSENLLEEYILKKISWYLPDGLFSKSYLDNKLLFDENLLAGQDRDFYIRLLCVEKPRIEILEFYGTFYRIHTASISQKIYRNGNYKMQLTHYMSLINQVGILKQYNYLNIDLKKHYAYEISKRLPAVIKAQNSVSDYFSFLFGLSTFNLHTIKIWAKVMFSYISFIFFGKGERFLK